MKGLLKGLTVLVIRISIGICIGICIHIDICIKIYICIKTHVGRRREVVMVTRYD